MPQPSEESSACGAKDDGHTEYGQMEAIHKPVPPVTPAEVPVPSATSVPPVAPAASKPAPVPPAAHDHEPAPVPPVPQKDSPKPEKNCDHPNVHPNDHHDNPKDTNHPHPGDKPCDKPGHKPLFRPPYKLGQQVAAFVLSLLAIVNGIASVLAPIGFMGAMLSVAVLVFAIMGICFAAGKKKRSPLTSSAKIMAVVAILLSLLYLVYYLNNQGLLAGAIKLCNSIFAGSK